MSKRSPDIDKVWTIPEGEFASNEFLRAHEWGYGDFSVCCRELLKRRAADPEQPMTPTQIAKSVVLEWMKRNDLTSGDRERFPTVDLAQPVREGLERDIARAIIVAKKESP